MTTLDGQVDRSSADRVRPRRLALGTLVEQTHLPTVMFLAAVILTWWALSQRLGQYLLPSPERVLEGVLALGASGELWVHVAATLYRVTLGFSFAVLIALLAGFLVAQVPFARMVVKDVTVILNSMSVFVWIVLALIWFGLSDTAPIFTTFMVTLPVMLSNVIAGVESIDRKLLEMARVYKFSGLDRFRIVAVPSMAPYLVAGMKVALSLALRISVIAEIFGVSTGIGYMMNFSRDTLRTDMVFAWALVLILVMVLIEKILLDSFDRRFNGWRH
jgi:NitT/TauT family transport system permease protein